MDARSWRHAGRARVVLRGARDARGRRVSPARPGNRGSGTWLLWGYNAFGLSLLPLLVGIGWLFYDGRSVGGWLLTGAGALIILAGIIANLHLFFAPTSLFDTLVMLGLLAGGLGLVARSLRAQPEA